MTAVRWLFGDQLGPWYLEGHPDDAPVLLIESRAVLARRRWHRQKLHLVLSAMRHRAAELGGRARQGSCRHELTGYRQSFTRQPASFHVP